MEKLSLTQIFSLCLITINSLSTNIFLVLHALKQNKIMSFFNSIELEKEKGSQMTQVLDKGMVKVAICENFAYWVINNEIYKAEVDKEGRVDSEKASIVDVFKLSEMEVTKLLQIIDSMNN